MTTLATPTANALWLEIKTSLEGKKNLINDEIRNYPPPIPACDAQFNYLLEERARLTAELNRLQEFVSQVADDDNAVQLLNEYMATCPDIDTNSD